MSKPKTPNQRNEYKKLNARLDSYALMVEELYETLALEAAKKAAMVGYDGTMEFHFDDYPQLKAQVDEMMYQWVSDMDTLIYQGTSAEWMNSNVVQSLMADKVLKAYTATVDREKYKVYYETNSQALQTFQKRRDRGMSLSDKIWRQEKSLRYELEEAISCAIQKGTSAVTLSKRISKYLNDYPKLQQDYGKMYGKATRSSDCEYRSMRLARSEINMAYRGAENERWRQFDFVVGYEIKVSHKHSVPDICDDLQGKYPKDFQWVGWHPNCTDYKIPILKTEDEFFSLDNKPSVNEVNDVPPQFKKWVQENQDSIKRAEARGTAPYFVMDNRKLVDGLMEVHEVRPDQMMMMISEANPKFSMSADKVNQLQVDGFKFLGFGGNAAKMYNNSQISGFDVVAFDRVVEGICDKYEVRLSRKAISRYPDGEVVLNYEGYNKHLEDFNLMRRFHNEDGKRIVDHQLFSIPYEMQGKGVSKDIFRGLFSQYEAMGIDEIRVEANMSVGGYTWGKYGFSTDKATAKRIINEAVEIGSIGDRLGLNLMQRIDEYEDLFPMDVIANLPEGKKILLGTRWDGYFNMNNIEQMDVLREYLRK